MSVRVKHFDIHLWGIRSIQFPSKDGEVASYWAGDGWKSCWFPARVGIPILIY